MLAVVMFQLVEELVTQVAADLLRAALEENELVLVQPDAQVMT